MSMMIPEEEYQRRKRASNAAADREKRSRIIEDYKRCLACIICGEAEPSCLDFHHRNPEEKEFAVSEVMHKFSLPRIMNEIAKCTVLCSNCHRKLHAGLVKL